MLESNPAVPLASAPNEESKENNYSDYAICQDSLIQPQESVSNSSFQNPFGQDDDEIWKDKAKAKPKWLEESSDFGSPILSPKSYGKKIQFGVFDSAVMERVNQKLKDLEEDEGPIAIGITPQGTGLDTGTFVKKDLFEPEC